jgi:hypothetical protein
MITQTNTTHSPILMTHSQSRSGHVQWLRRAAVFAASMAAVYAASASDYSDTVKNDRPLVYYPFNDVTPTDVAANSGSTGVAGNGVTTGAVVHRAAGAMADGRGAGVTYSTGCHTLVPFQSAVNPASTKPFSVEFWANPTADTDDSVGPCPLFNRVSSGNRSGWVFFQRSPSTGWNFRVFSGSGSSTGVSITGGTAQSGSWSHVVAVWDGTAASLYVNGSLVAGPTVATGYKASDAAILALGSYDTGENQFNGTLDDVAIYTNALTAAQVLKHYETALSTSPTVSYSSLVLSQKPVEYLRLEDAGPANDIAINQGTSGLSGDGTHFPGMVHQVPGALVGSSNTAASYTAIDASSCDGAVPTRVAFNPALNTETFTVEAWLKPTADGLSNAQCPLYNRREDSPRTGWVFFQRDQSTGWNFRAYNGVDTARSIDLTGGPYTLGQWAHVAATFDGTTGRLYVNGTQVASQAVVGSYAPNTDTIQFCVGGFFDGSQNPFIGAVDEVALYDSALSGSQILTHYQIGTNAARLTPYETLVLSANPVEYLRLDEPATKTVANSGTLGVDANGVYVNTTNILTGPTTAGFLSGELAVPFDGALSYVELGNPSALNFQGPISLEAWVQPSSAQAFSDADIIAHGYNDNASAEVALRIESGVYQIVAHDSADHLASYEVPSDDLGTGNWVHLVGTYDGAKWNLYRNGVLVSSVADATGAVQVSNANWAIGARGRWKNVATYPDSGEDRVFLGGIDEPAIYNYALSEAQVARHYSTGLHGKLLLSYSLSGSTLTLTWSGGTLQQASTVNGSFADVSNATSPYTVNLNGSTQKYFRLRY